MTRRRAVVGFSFLCALVLCAFAASPANALRGTTAYVCKAEAAPTELTNGFEDEHCTKAVSGAGVKRIHEEIKAGVKTALVATNNETEAKFVNPKFKATVAGVEVTLEAKGFTTCPNTNVENKENGAKQMEAAGEFCGSFAEVTVTKPLKCEVKAKTITLNEKGIAKTVVKEPKANEHEMYVEFLPPEGKPFTTFTLEGAECALKGVKVEVTGTAKATVTTEEGCSIREGPTLKFTTGGTGATLKANGVVAMFEGTFTARKAPEKEKAGDPVVLTTTNS
jgi:hypothetical protein